MLRQKNIDASFKKVKHNLGLRIIKVEKTQIDSIGLIAIFNWMLTLLHVKVSY